MNAIKQIRKQLGLSQFALSKELGVSQSSVSQYECGSITPSPHVAKRIVKLAKRKKVRRIGLDLIYQGGDAHQCPHP